MRVLVIEDEARTAEYLQKGLTESGFVVGIVQSDRGYDRDKYRRPLHANGISTEIARRGESHGSGFGKKNRWVVERTIA